MVRCSLKRSFRLAIVLLLGLGLSSLSLAAAPAEDQFPRGALTAINGAQVPLENIRGRLATVLVCVSIECPISNEYISTLNELAERYTPRGANFVGLNPNAGESLDQMAVYVRDQKVPFPFLQDPGGKIARGLMFKVTPEIAVFDAAGELVYRGRIDDRYRAGGGAPDAKITPELAQALDEVLAGKPVSVNRTKPSGCPIQLTAPGK